MPPGFPAWKTVYWYFTTWKNDGALYRVHTGLRKAVRTAAGRAPQPSAAVVDSPPARAADTVGAATRGWDNGKKVNGRKRHIVADTAGNLLAVAITPANRHDTAAARTLVDHIAARCGRVGLVWADSSYHGRLADYAAEAGIDLEIVRTQDGQTTFVVLPRRRVVERTFARISKHRRRARDYERNPANQAAMTLWASATRMLNHPT
ncbi:MAG: IS5 family transposase [Stackebrandtia sp.]